MASLWRGDQGLNELLAEKQKEIAALSWSESIAQTTDAQQQATCNSKTLHHAEELSRLAPTPDSSVLASRQ